MAIIEDHPLRYQLANELHARPFPSMKAPYAAAYIAFKQPKMAASRDRNSDNEHLFKLLDRHGAPTLNLVQPITTDKLAAIG